MGLTLFKISVEPVFVDLDLYLTPILVGSIVDVVFPYLSTAVEKFEVPPALSKTCCISRLDSVFDCSILGRY